MTVAPDAKRARAQGGRDPLDQANRLREEDGGLVARHFDHAVEVAFGHDFDPCAAELHAGPLQRDAKGVVLNADFLLGCLQGQAKFVRFVPRIHSQLVADGGADAAEDFAECRRHRPGLHQKRERGPFEQPQATFRVAGFVEHLAVGDGQAAAAFERLLRDGGAEEVPQIGPVGLILQLAQAIRGDLKRDGRHDERPEQRAVSRFVDAHDDGRVGHGDPSYRASDETQMRGHSPRRQSCEFLMPTDMNRARRRARVSAWRFTNINGVASVCGAARGVSQLSGAATLQRLKKSTRRNPCLRRGLC